MGTALHNTQAGNQTVLYHQAIQSIDGLKPFTNKTIYYNCVKEATFIACSINSNDFLRLFSKAVFTVA